MILSSLLEDGNQEFIIILCHIFMNPAKICTHTVFLILLYICLIIHKGNVYTVVSFCVIHCYYEMYLDYLIFVRLFFFGY